MTKEQLHDEIDKWFHDRIHNSPVSVHTEAYNHVRGEVENLKGRLSKVFFETPDEPKHDQPEAHPVGDHLG